VTGKSGSSKQGGNASHKGKFLGYAPTWKTVEWAGAALFTIENARIAELWVLGDVHGLLGQLSTNVEAGSPDG